MGAALTQIADRDRMTLSAVAMSAGATGPEVLRGSVLVVRNTFDDPIVIVVMVAPQLYHIHSVADGEAAFRAALLRHGITSTLKVGTLPG
jgi:hypothetical protein